MAANKAATVSPVDSTSYPHNIVFHHKEQAEQALAAVQDRDVSLRLFTAPGVAERCGPKYLEHLARRVRQNHPKVDAHFIIDCGKDLPTALRALAAGWTDMVFDQRGKAARQVADLVKAAGGTLYQRPRTAYRFNAHDTLLKIDAN